MIFYKNTLVLGLVFLVGCWTDESDDFLYSGFPEMPIGEECDGIAPEALDDYSQESTGRCIINSREYRFNYDAIEKYFLDVQESRRLYLRTIRTLDESIYDESVNTCKEAHLMVEIKKYLQNRETATNNFVNASDNTEISEILNGSTTTNSESQSIVQLEFLSTSGVNYFCTGTVINDRWILTAAHCVAPSMSSGDVAWCQNCFEAKWWNPTDGALECITDTGICPKRNALLVKHGSWFGTGDNGDDIGLINYIPGWSKNIEEGRLFNETPSHWESDVYIYGNGDNDGCGFGTGTKRKGSFDVDFVRSYEVVSYREYGFEAGTCYGDSGGAWILQQGTKLLQFGVHSASDHDIVLCGSPPVPKESTCTGVDKSTRSCRVDRKIGWIKTKTGLNCPSYSINGYSYVRCTR